MAEQLQQEQEQEQPKPQPPSKFTPGERSLNDIIYDLRKPIHPKFLGRKTQGKTEIIYLPWYNAVRYLDAYAPGWSYRIASITQVGALCAVVAEIAIPTSDGVITRQATGCEDDDKSGYGDPTSNAESMALRRAAAKFGLGLYLYDK